MLLVGPSGSGKSTLLRALAGLLETVDAGELTGAVTVDGVAPGERPGAVGLVLQEPGAGVVAASVGRDVAFGPENVRMPRAAMAGVVASALGSVGLGDLPLDTPTSALSGGQTQRLALAGTLALDPSVVLLDEPTAMLDPASAQEVRDAVAALTPGRGWPVVGADPLGPATGHPSPTLVVVEHVLGPWVDLVDRLVVLVGGRAGGRRRAGARDARDPAGPAAGHGHLGAGGGAAQAGRPSTRRSWRRGATRTHRPGDSTVLRLGSALSSRREPLLWGPLRSWSSGPPGSSTAPPAPAVPRCSPTPSSPRRGR